MKNECFDQYGYFDEQIVKVEQLFRAIEEYKALKRVFVRTPVEMNEAVAEAIRGCKALIVEQLVELA